MRHNLNKLLWAVVLAAGFLFVGPSPAHAQVGSCTSICNSNTSCDTGCYGFAGFTEDTTCGAGGFPCCTDETTTTPYCTAQYLNANFKCVNVERDMVTTTCGDRTTISFVDTKTKTPNATCETCPSQHTPGCEDLTSPICPNP